MTSMSPTVGSKRRTLPRGCTAAEALGGRPTACFEPVEPRSSARPSGRPAARPRAAGSHCASRASAPAEGASLLVVRGVERRLRGDVRGGDDAVPAMRADDVGRVDLGQRAAGRRGRAGRRASSAATTAATPLVGHVPQRRRPPPSGQRRPRSSSRRAALSRSRRSLSGQVVHVRGGAEQGIGAGPIAADVGDGRQRGERARQRLEVRAREGVEEGQPFAAPAAGGLVRRASLVSMGRLAAAHSGRPPLSTTAWNPRSISEATTRAADDLVGVGVVDDDVAVLGRRERLRLVRRDADRARQQQRAVLVGVLEPGVDEQRRLAGVEPFLDGFFGDAGNGHRGARVSGGRWAPRHRWRVSAAARVASPAPWRSAAVMRAGASPVHHGAAPGPQGVRATGPGRERGRAPRVLTANTDNCFCNSCPWQDGHSGGSDPRTTTSNRWSQAEQTVPEDRHPGIIAFQAPAPSGPWRPAEAGRQAQTARDAATPRPSLEVHRRPAVSRPRGTCGTDAADTRPGGALPPAPSHEDRHASERWAGR